MPHQSPFCCCHCPCHCQQPTGSKQQTAAIAHPPTILFSRFLVCMLFLLLLHARWHSLWSPRCRFLVASTDYQLPFARCMCLYCFCFCCYCYSCCGLCCCWLQFDCVFRVYLCLLKYEAVRVQIHTHTYPHKMCIHIVLCLCVCAPVLSRSDLCLLLHVVKFVAGLLSKIVAIVCSRSATSVRLFQF